MGPLLFGLLAALFVAVVLFIAAIRIVNEYERGVIFRLGRVIGAKGPGLFFIIPIIDRMVKVNLQTIAADIPPQDVITKDNVTLRVNAVTYFNVIDPVRAVVAVQNYMFATSQIAQTTLRSILGQVDLDDILGQRDEINAQLQRVIDGMTDPWGVKVSAVEVKDVELPEGMRRAMGRQAEAERDRRAKVIHAHGEKEAAQTLSEAAAALERNPSSMQLRLLSTMTEVAAEHNSTLIFPIPMELLRFAQAMGVDVPNGGGGSSSSSSPSPSASPPSPSTPPPESSAVARPAGDDPPAVGRGELFDEANAPSVGGDDSPVGGGASDDQPYLPPPEPPLPPA